MKSLWAHLTDLPAGRQGNRQLPTSIAYPQMPSSGLPAQAGTAAEPLIYIGDPGHRSCKTIFDFAASREARERISRLKSMIR